MFKFVTLALFFVLLVQQEALSGIISQKDIFSSEVSSEQDKNGINANESDIHFYLYTQ
jgi:hypothetical protein